MPLVNTLAYAAGIICAEYILASINRGPFGPPSILMKSLYEGYKLDRNILSWFSSSRNCSCPRGSIYSTSLEEADEKVPVARRLLRVLLTRPRRKWALNRATLPMRIIALMCNVNPSVTVGGWKLNRSEESIVCRVSGTDRYRETSEWVYKRAQDDGKQLTLFSKSSRMPGKVWLMSSSESALGHPVETA